MQRFDASIHHFGKVSQLRNFNRVNTMALQVTSRTTGTVNLYTCSGQTGSEINQAKLVTATDERSTYTRWFRHEYEQLSDESNVNWTCER